MNIISGVFCLLIAASCAISTNVKADELFRADSRPPKEVKKLGGLLARGQDDAYERGTPQNINLFDHVRGAPTGNTRYDDGYVSTTRTLTQAHNIGQNMFGGVSGYYIYVIAPAPNMFDVNGVLRQYSPHPYENEVAALGGVPWSQIIGWYYVHFGVIEGGMTRNPGYRAGLFRGLDIATNEDGYRLAGFPDGHHAWREEPWRSHAPSQCASDLRSVTCNAIINGLSKNRLTKFKRKLRSLNAGIFLVISE